MRMMICRWKMRDDEVLVGDYFDYSMGIVLEMGMNVVKIVVVVKWVLCI